MLGGETIDACSQGRREFLQTGRWFGLAERGPPKGQEGVKADRYDDSGAKHEYLRQGGRWICMRQFECRSQRPALHGGPYALHQRPRLLLRVDGSVQLRLAHRVEQFLEDRSRLEPRLNQILPGENRRRVEVIL